MTKLSSLYLIYFGFIERKDTNDKNKKMIKRILILFFLLIRMLSLAQIYQDAHLETVQDNSMKYDKCLQYYSNGQLKYEKNYFNNKLHGVFKGYFDNGNIRRVDYYKNESLLNGKCYTKNGVDTNYYYRPA